MATKKRNLDRHRQTEATGLAASPNSPSRAAASPPPRPLQCPGNPLPPSAPHILLQDLEVPDCTKAISNPPISFHLRIPLPILVELFGIRR